VFADAPRLIAIPPAVFPLPYSFVSAEPADAHVHFFVLLLGLTPVPSDCADEPVQSLNLPEGVGAELADWVAVLALELVLAAAV
jgi:hypothetical protein